MTAVARYVPGDWVAVSAPGAWLLVALPPDHPIVLRSWDLMSGEGQAEDILDALTSGGIKATPNFAFACAAGQRRVLVRGAATILVTDSVGAVQLKVAAEPNTVWAEESFDETVDLLLLLTSGTESATEIELPMAAGVTMASSIRVHLHGPVPTTAADVSAEDSEGTRSAVTTTDAGEPVAQPDLAGSASAARSTEKVTGPGRSPSEGAGQSAADIAVATSDDAGGSYDFLFGATQRPLPPEAEVSSERTASVPPSTAANDPVTDGSATGHTAPPPDPSLTAGWSTMVPPELPLAEESPTTTSGSPVIDAVPWLAATSAGHAAPPPPVRPGPADYRAVVALHGDRTQSQAAQPAEDDVALTVDRAALLAGTGALPTGPTVLAGYCPGGHLSPPYGATCRVCHTPMPAGQQGFEIVRPALGIIRLADGGSVTLDRGVLFGRAPETVAEAEERPHLVRLVSPENDVSRNHAQIVIDGWHVYVKDLGSTNGTVVTLPGRAPVRLRPEDLQLLEHGSQITLADEITVTFEVTA